MFSFLFCYTRARALNRTRFLETLRYDTTTTKGSFIFNHAHFQSFFHDVSLSSAEARSVRLGRGVYEIEQSNLILIMQLNSIDLKSSDHMTSDENLF